MTTSSIVPVRFRLLVHTVAVGSALAGPLQAADTARRPLEIATAAAAIVRRDAAFEVRTVPWRPTLGIQMIDFARQNGGAFEGVCFARSTLTVRETGDFSFGFAGAGRLRAWIDDQLVFSAVLTESTAPVEYAYDRFRWPGRFAWSLQAGVHRVLIEARATGGQGRFFLQACDEHSAVDDRIAFAAELTGESPESAGGWWITGPWQLAPDASPDSSPPEALRGNPVSPLFVLQDRAGGWRRPARDLVEDFTVRSGAAFNQHSLVEWHYANGATHLALLELADATGDADVRAQVDRFVGFTLERLPSHRFQYEELLAWRGANYRIFRGCLLDDTSAPALPFIELVRRGELPAAVPLVGQILDFVLTRHPRLADGTLCRDEPESQTVWADDLFMSAAFLVRAAQWKNDPRIWDDVVQQVGRFHAHLADTQTGLYWHGRYAARGQPAAFHWGRANGWMAWAASEVLRFLPANHPGRADIIDLHRRHLEALLPLQAPSGMWRQVLDRPGSYEETSATAMFLIAIARALRAGWLEEARFGGPARRAWAGLQIRVDDSGVVHGICRGTGIGDSLEYYLQRATRDHDPRGLGAFIVAAIEAQNLPPAIAAESTVLPGRPDVVATRQRQESAGPDSYAVQRRASFLRGPVFWR